jgi:glycosyltransferase involved in cell wall biosynthesis
MKFFIITPSFNQLDYLKRCVASVADQAAPQAQRSDVGSQRSDVLISDLRSLISGGGSPIRVHHHVQDGGSSDGTVDWLRQYKLDVERGMLNVKDDASPNNSTTSNLSTDSPQQPATSNYQLTFASEADEGMYDALNKGIAFALQERPVSCQLPVDDNFTNNQQRTTGNCDDPIVAWLNCDEQYLPGTLARVGKWFSENPAPDILFGGMLMVDPSGRLLACRKAMPMRRLFLEASYLYNYSCAMFVHGSFWKRLGGFDPAYRNAGDEELIHRAVSAGAKTAVLREYLSAFTYSEDNLSSTRVALEEHEALKQTGSAVIRWFKLPINLLRLAEKAARSGHVQKTPVFYEIYTDDRSQRYRFEVDQPSCKWPGASQPYLASHRLK